LSSVSTIGRERRRLLRAMAKAVARIKYFMTFS
jgi:hypothetical protein